jgi:DNA (cytosine-5)-methyltransferase 1
MCSSTSVRDAGQDHCTNESSAPLAIDLFAGAGGLSLGALQAGFDVVGAVEKSKHAVKTYHRNVKRPNGEPIGLIECDILDLKPYDALKKWGLVAGQCDLIMGGPPCQGFSTHRLNGTGIDDPRNSLLATYFDFVSVLKPKMFLVENVPGLLWERHKSYLDSFLESAEAAEFDIIGPVLLNAKDFGVPQNRRRVFILGLSRGFKREVAWPPKSTHVGPSTEDEVRQGRPFWRTAADAFVPALKDDPNDVHMNSTEELIEVFMSTPANGGSRSQSSRRLNCHKDHNGHKDVYGRINPLKPGPTMTTACINPSKGRFVHPVEHHGITLRQAARFQTFPEEFIFEGGLIAGGEQIGNAVPVKLAKALLEPLRSILIAAESEHLVSSISA